MSKTSFGVVLLWLLVTSCVHADERKPATLRVAIYDDAGGNSAGPNNVERCLTASEGFACSRVTAAHIRAGALGRFDVLVQPGGSGSAQAKSLGAEGRAEIRKFVDGGRGFVGICAGAYLASADYDWSLHILDAKVLDRKHWNRGSGNVQLRLTTAGQQVLADDRELVPVQYNQGPLLAPGEKSDIPDYELLATFETEVAENGAVPGVMKGTAAAARGTFGRGRVWCYSPHPEKDLGPHDFIRKAVRWAGGQP